MKHIKSTLAALLAVALTGCASTSQPDRTDYPTLTVLNPTPYVWDDKKSLALNVAKMAEPAGVGIGLEDSDKASDASTGQSSAGDRALGLGIMGLSQGVFGLVSDSVITNDAEKALRWKPSLIEFIPVSDVGLDLTPGTFQKLRSLVGERLLANLKKDFPDVVMLAVYTPKRSNWKTNAIYQLKTQGCHESIKFHSYKPDSAPLYATRDYSVDTLEGVKMPSEYCQVSMRISVSGTTNVNGVLNYIVVNELIWGQNFLVQLSKPNRYSGYILIPERFDVPTYDIGTDKEKTLYPHAVVFHEGKPHNFVTPK